MMYNLRDFLAINRLLLIFFYVVLLTVRFTMNDILSRQIKYHCRSSRWTIFEVHTSTGCWYKWRLFHNILSSPFKSISTIPLNDFKRDFVIAACSIYIYIYSVFRYTLTELTHYCLYSFADLKITLK